MSAIEIPFIARPVGRSLTYPPTRMLISLKTGNKLPYYKPTFALLIGGLNSYVDSFTNYA